MKILIFGDIFGRIGRKALEKEIILLKKKYVPDFLVANVDNISSGRGVVEKHILEMEKLGIDVATGGDHIFDNENNIENYLKRDKCILIRPANFYESKYYKIFGNGYKIIEKNGKKLLVIHLIGEVFMKYNVYNPFLKIDEILSNLSSEKFDAIIIDFHKEVTSEGYGMLHFLDGKISLLYGTHTHVQTNDEFITEKGTGFLSDVGMIGPINSVIGADFYSLRKRFLTGITKGKIEQDLGNEYLLNSIFVDIDDSGKCREIEKIKIKGKI